MTELIIITIFAIGTDTAVSPQKSEVQGSRRLADTLYCSSITHICKLEIQGTVPDINILPYISNKKEQSAGSCGFALLPRRPAVYSDAPSWFHPQLSPVTPEPIFLSS
jgi:hypothetical protein